MSSQSPSASLRISFEGWFLVRLTTDPDPTDERRGVSGYTLAVAGEPDLDNWIRFNPPHELLREPARALAANGRMNVGVRVTAVSQQGPGQPAVAGAERLVGGTVELLADPELGAPVFEGRNDIVGSDDTIEFPIDPFVIQVSSPAGTPVAVVERADRLAEPGPIWQLPAESFAYRVGRTPPDGAESMEVMNAINVYDPYEYFRDRRRWLEGRLGDDSLDAAAREALRTRLYAIDFFGERIRSRLGLRRVWDFSISRSTGRVSGFGGVDLEAPWPVSFWMGGFDGDLMMGYLRGTLTLPLLDQLR